jgi:hypothetical protein
MNAVFRKNLSEDLQSDANGARQARGTSGALGDGNDRARFSGRQ